MRLTMAITSARSCGTSRWPNLIGLAFCACDDCSVVSETKPAEPRAPDAKLYAQVLRPKPPALLEPYDLVREIDPVTHRGAGPPHPP